MAPKKSSQGRVSIPKYRWLMFWLLVLCSVALVCAIFGRVDVRTLLSKPEVKVVERVVEIEKPQETSQPLGRLMVTELPGCDYEFNINAPAGYLTYSGPPDGISIQIPYNPDWGNELYTPVPYSGDRFGVTFGPLQNVGEGCGAFQVNRIDFRSATSSTAYLRLLRQVAEEVPYEGASDIRQRTINGMVVLSYVQNTALGISYNVWDAFGDNYHYEISSYGWLTDVDAVKIIQSLRVTK